MPLDVTCPEGHKLIVPDRMAGTTVRCPKCSASTVVPKLATSTTELEFSAIDLMDADELPIAPISKRRKKPNPIAESSETKQAASPRAPSKPHWLLFGGGAILLVFIGVMVGALLNRSLRTAPIPNIAVKSAPQQDANRVSVSSIQPDNIESRNTPLTVSNDEVKKPAPVVTTSNDTAQPAPIVTPTSPPTIAPMPTHFNTPPSTAITAATTTPAVLTSRAHEIVELPAPVRQVVVGGSGQYLIAFLPNSKQVAVVDVVSKQIVKMIPVDDTDVLVAGGQTKFIILQRGLGVISRFDLTTFERELTVASESYKGIALGSSSEGPLLAIGDVTHVLSLETLKPNGAPANVPQGFDSSNLLAAANGTIFTSWRQFGTPSGMSVLEINGSTVRANYEHNSYGPVLPSPDGRVIYVGNARLGPDCKRLVGAAGGNGQISAFPAVTGTFSMSLLGADTAGGRTTLPMRLRVHCQNDDVPILTASDVFLPDTPPNNHSQINATLPLYQRLIWLPNVDTLLTVPSSSDKFIFQHFNLKEELDKGGTDYLFVSSSPPSSIQSGQTFTYPIEVFSKHGNVQYSLESGPPGMVVSSNGVVTWKFPSNFTQNNIVALINIQDKSGQKISHTIKSTIVAPSTDLSVATTHVPGKPQKRDGTALRKPIPQMMPKRNTSVADSNPATVNSIARVREAVSLPGAMQQTVVGGSGKYLITYIQSRKQVIVVEVDLKKIVKSIPVDDNDVLLAAGETAFVVLQRGNGVISRYKFATFERELSIACDPHASLAMGSSSEGPLLTGGASLGVLDLQTLKPSEINGNLNQANTVVASANGKVFGCWPEGGGWGLSVLELDGSTFRRTICPPQISLGAIRLSSDGAVIYSGQGRYTRDFQLLDGTNRANNARVLIPASTGPYYLSMMLAGIAGSTESGPTRLTVHCQNDDAPLFTATDVALPEIPPNTHPAHVARLGLERRIFLLPVAKALVTVPQTLDTFIIHEFNVKDELDRSGIDYFFVTSIPPKRFTQGQDFEYAIDVVSKHGNPRFELDLNPVGMTISKEGLVRWSVPRDFAEKAVVAMVKIRDDSGQELVHTIKLTDGLPTTPASPVNVAMPAPPAVPASVPRTALPALQSTVPKSAGQNQWRWAGPPPICVYDEKGSVAAIRSGNNLYSIKGDGTLDVDGITLSTDFTYMGIRDKQLIGVAANPTRVEILDRTGKEVRKVMLENAPPTSLALHPNKPICYVSLDRTVGQFRGTFVAIDEQLGTVKSEDEQLGQDVAVDPTGRFLVSTYVHKVHLGDQVVVMQQPRTMPTPRGIPRRGRFQPPMRGPAPAAPQVGVRHTFANVALTLVYDLDTPLQPEIHTVGPLNMPTGRMRFSFDGRRMTSMARDSKLAKYAACNSLDLKAPLIEYDLAVPAGRNVLGSDLTCHPLLPITIVAGAGTIRFFNSEDGKPIASKDSIDIPELADKSLQRVLTSADGKHVIVVATGNSNDHILASAKLPLTDSERNSMKLRASGSPKHLKESSPPLTDLTALGGGVPEAMSAADISGKYADTVVIVRSGNSTGTGFIVGSSGLILTCAHCVSPLESVEVVYHPTGNIDEKETVEAIVVHRDRKRDLALLKIDVERPLHAAMLADPVGVKSGADVTIIANPGLGNEVLENTVTTGIISNAKRTIGGNDYIQSSAAVNPGSSGGPMFNQSGRVIGVVVLKAGIDGVGFAVPPESITKFLLKATRSDGARGQLVRGWIDSKSKLLGQFRLIKIDKSSVTLVNSSNGKTQTHPIADFSPGDQKLLELIAADE